MYLQIKNDMILWTYKEGENKKTKYKKSERKVQTTKTLKFYPSN